MSSENQKIVMTKRLVKEGLLQLLQQKHIDDVRINELCKLADINRTTFYRHYRSPHDVLVEIGFDLAREFHELPTKAVTDVHERVANLCDFLFARKKTVKLFMRNNTYVDTGLIFQNFAEDFNGFKEPLFGDRKIDPHVLRLMTTFFAYGCYTLVSRWLLEDIPLAPDSVADLIVHMIYHELDT